MPFITMGGGSSSCGFFVKNHVLAINNTDDKLYNQGWTEPGVNDDRIL